MRLFSSTVTKSVKHFIILSLKCSIYNVISFNSIKLLINFFPLSFILFLISCSIIDERNLYEKLCLSGC